MSQPKPFFLTVRQFADDEYSEGGRARYVSHREYSIKPSNYIRAFLLLQKDLLELFNYIEPADKSLETYSFRIHELLVRTCIEIEANFRAIFTVNKYGPFRNGANLSMEDFYKINRSHFLSSYKVEVPYWSGDPETAVRRPFKSWADQKDSAKPWVLSWYQDYNLAKHDRVNALPLANFKNLLDAFSALVILITAQYLFDDFSPAPGALLLESESGDDFECAIGDYFRIRLPHDVPMEERYEFDWQVLSLESSPFAQFDYDAIN